MPFLQRSLQQAFLRESLHTKHSLEEKGWNFKNIMIDNANATAILTEKPYSCKIKILNNYINFKSEDSHTHLLFLVFQVENPGSNLILVFRIRGFIFLENGFFYHFRKLFRSVDSAFRQFSITYKTNNSD